MTQPLTMERNAGALPRIGVSSTAGPIVARSLLASRLEIGVAGLLTVVQASPGAGKTTGVATWASTVTEPRGLVWLELDESTAQPNSFVPRLVEAFAGAATAGIPQLGLRNLRALSRRRAVLAALADALRTSGPWVLVLDDFPVGSSGALGADLEYLIEQCHRALRVVILTKGRPSIALHRLRMAGELATIGSDALDLDRVEVAQLLRLHGVVANERLVTTVLEHTYGWAAGVRLACLALRDQSLDAAMAYTDDAVDEFLTNEVLDALPVDLQPVVERLGLVGSVPPALVAPGGRRAASSARRAADLTASVSFGLDGRVSLHPVMRSVAARRLTESAPAKARAWTLVAAAWYADEGDMDGAFGLAGGAGEWAWIGRRLVERFAVHEVLLGCASAWATHPEVLACEPALRAAVAVAAGDLAQARLALSDVQATRSLADELSASLVELAIATRTGDHQVGIDAAASIRDVVASAPASMQELAAELRSTVDGGEGALHFGIGHLNRAAVVLGRVTSSPELKRCSPVRRQAIGGLALVEAVRGNLSAASTLVDEVMTASDRFGGRAGVGEAMIASAWISVNRLNLDEARSALERFRSEAGSQYPLAEALRGVIEIRLALSAAEPDYAVREARALSARDELPAWTRDLASIEFAQAWLAQGEPRRALESLTPEPLTATTEARVAGAAARLVIGDLRGARALLAAASNGLVDAPLDVQIDGWVLEARLAYEDGNEDRGRQLVDRAMRVARPELLRRPLAPNHVWLRGLIGREQSLRAHREFVASLTSTNPVLPPSQVVNRSHAVEQVIEPLSDRETQVLELLSMMCSTDEIAAELFVSGNTVKTHVKSIFRKLGVNRRVDAVRVGRARGIC